MKVRGVGVGAMVYGLGYGFSRPDFSTTDIELAPDGTITIWNGASGTWSRSTDLLLCQLVAQELGIPYEDTFIISADTGRTPDAGPVSAEPFDLCAGKLCTQSVPTCKRIIVSPCK